MSIRCLLILLALTFGVSLPAAAQTLGTLPAGAAITGATNSVAAGSALTGVQFAEPAQSLPIDTRFSQAIQTIAFDLGLSCGQIEAYGWPLNARDAAAQTRVEAIFRTTAEQLNQKNYVITPQSPGSAAADITVYTAHTNTQNMLLTWSAGDAGLLLLQCATQEKIMDAPTLGQPAFGAANNLSMGEKSTKPARAPLKSIIGEWRGTYSCVGQGAAGGTLTITNLRRSKDGQQVDGTFSFYPLNDKNPDLPRGTYRVKGLYDSASGRAILEPGAWIKRPADFYNAVMITQFDLTERRASGIFQGSTGCTSFEAAYVEGSAKPPAKKRAKPKPKPKAEPAVAATPNNTTESLAPITLPTDGASVTPPEAQPLQPITPPTTEAPSVPPPAAAAPVAESPAAPPLPAAPKEPAPSPAPTAAPAAAPESSAPIAAPPPAPTSADPAAEPRKLFAPKVDTDKAAVITPPTAAEIAAKELEAKVAAEAAAKAAAAAAAATQATDAAANTADKIAIPPVALPAGN